MALKLITAPTKLPVTVTEAKAQMAVDASDRDTLITRLVAAAIAYFDGWTGILGRALEQQTWDLTFDAFPGRVIELPLGPLLSIDSVNYINPATGLEVALDPSLYEVDITSLPGRVVAAIGTTWPATPVATVNAVRIRFTCGYARATGDVTTVPEPIRHAIVMLAAHWLDNREGEAIPQGILGLVAPLRVRSL